LGLDDDRVGAGVDEGLGLFGERGADFVFGELAVGLHEAAERADVADDVAVLSMIRLPPNVLVRMQSEPASA
jgi:hypothetical protein